MIVRVLAEASTIAQIIHSAPVELGVKLIKVSHNAGVEWRQTLVSVFFWRGLVPEVKRKRVTIVTQCVALEPAPPPVYMRCATCQCGGLEI